MNVTAHVTCIVETGLEDETLLAVKQIESAESHQILFEIIIKIQFLFLFPVSDRCINLYLIKMSMIESVFQTAGFLEGKCLIRRFLKPENQFMSLMTAFRLQNYIIDFLTGYLRFFNFQKSQTVKLYIFETAEISPG